MAIEQKRAVSRKRAVPSDPKQILTIAKYELLNDIRSKRFSILFLVILSGSICATGVVGFFRPSSMMSDSNSFLTHWLEYTLPFIVALPASFLGGDTISREFQTRTGYSMIGNPIKRSSLLLGKVLSCAASSILMLAIYEIVMVLNSLFYFGLQGISIQLGESFVFALLAVLGALGLAFFFSSLIRNGAVSVLFTAFLLLYGFNLVQNVLSHLTSIEPWFLLSYSVDLVINVFVVPFPPHVINSAGRIAYNPTVPEGVAIMLGYFILGVLVSLMFFRRKELV